MRIESENQVNQKFDAENAKVQVQIVTFNSADVIEKCLLSVFEQTIDISIIVVISNSSSDDILKLLSEFIDRITIIGNTTINGYSGGHNLGIQIAISDRMDYVVTLKYCTDDCWGQLN